MQDVDCDCASLAWTAPTAATLTVNINASGEVTPANPVEDTSARSSVPAFDACYQESTDCATTGTYGVSAIKYYDDGVTAGGAALPSWITWDNATQKLTAAPDSTS